MAWHHRVRHIVQRYHHHIRSNPWQSLWEMLLVIAVPFAAAYLLWLLAS